jgi:radical SAM superfamily enzyme YgiQ (UPF0313 family)
MPTMKYPKTGLVALPWQEADILNVQLGSLKAHLGEKGVEVEARHYYKDVLGYMPFPIYRGIQSSSIGEHLCAALYFPQRRAAILDSIREHASQALIDVDRTLEQLSSFFDDVLSDLRTAQFDLVGFTTTHLQFMSSLLVAKVLADSQGHRPRIVFGGLALQTRLASDLLGFSPQIDYVVTGNGEVALQHIVEHLAGKRQLTECAHLVFRKNGHVVVSKEKCESLFAELATPDYDEYFSHFLPKSAGLQSLPALNVETSRGCNWGGCTFCIESTLERSGSGSRTRSAERVVEIVRALVHRYRSTEVVFSDADASGRVDVFQALADADFSVAITAEVAGFVRPAQLAIMKRAGLKGLQIGVESFSPRLLKYFNKSVTVMQYVRLMKACIELDLNLSYNIITRSPFETQADVDEAARNMRSLLPLQPPRVNDFVVSHGSLIAERPQAFEIDEIVPSRELVGYPKEVASSIGPLLAYHGGSDWRQNSGVALDYSEFDAALRDWHDAHAKGVSLSARRGVGFLDAFWRIDGRERHLLIDDPVDVRTYESIADQPRNLASIVDCTGDSVKQVNESLGKLAEPGLVFFDGESYFGLAQML